MAKKESSMHWLKAWRKRQGLTQKQAAALLGLKQRMIQNYESESHDIPRYVRLSCFALSEQVIDYDADGPIVSNDLVKMSETIRKK